MAGLGDRGVHYWAKRVSEITLSSPAKINLFLAITGRRPDGFHELVSVVAPLEWGDVLTLAVDLPRSVDSNGTNALVCDDPAVPLDETNLVVRAAEAFRAATGWRGSARFSLQKRIPMGAGLGGGSSNAAMALRALNQLTGAPLQPAALAGVAAKVGSDCALFLHDGPVVMRGRGERVDPLLPVAAARLRGQRVLLFKPAFGISTAWAYARLAAAGNYLPPAEAEARLANWLNAPTAPLAELLFNAMEPPAFLKFPALPTLLRKLRQDFGLAAMMTGSGSACFSLVDESSPIAEICAVIRRLWGESAIVVQTSLR